MKVLSADALRKTQRGNDDFDAMLAHDAYEVVMRDLMWKNVNYYITYALVFFAVFLASLFSHIPATDAMYQLGYSVSSTLAASGGDTITTDSTIKFANIQTISDTFDWLTDTFVPSVFVTEDYNGKALEKDKWGRVAMFNKVLGGVVFNTTRASIHSCESKQFLLDLYPNCYDPDHVTVDSVVISFDTNASTAAALINQLKDRGDWLSSATQKVEITVVTYNGQVEAYTVTDLTVTFHQGGFVEPSSSTTPALSDPLKGTHTLVLAALVGILLIGRFVVVVIKRRRMTNVTDFRLRRMLKAIGMDSDEVNIDFEWVVIIPVVAFYATVNELVKTMTSEAFQSHLARLDGSDKTFGVDSEERKGLGAVTDSLKQVAWLTVSLRFVAVIAVLLVGAMVLKAFHKHPRLGILTRTLDRSLRAFRSVFGVFIIVFVSFSASGTVLFGDRVKSFSSFGTSLETCINMLFGSFEYAAIQDMYISAPMLFYWTYMVVVSLVLLNMMLAIVLDAYTSVSAEIGARAPSSVVRGLLTVWWDVEETASDLKSCRWIKNVSGCLARSRQTTWSEKLAQCRELTADQVVTRRHIRPSALRLLLTGMCESQSGSRGKETQSASFPSGGRSCRQRVSSTGSRSRTSVTMSPRKPLISFKRGCPRRPSRLSSEKATIDERT